MLSSFSPMRKLTPTLCMDHNDPVTLSPPRSAANNGRLQATDHARDRVLLHLPDVVTRDTTSRSRLLLADHWIVVRTFDGFGRYRQLSHECEAINESGEDLIYAAMP
jgi:hypothetical protein